MTMLNVDIKSIASMAQKRIDDPVERRAPRLLITVGDHHLNLNVMLHTLLFLLLTLFVTSLFPSDTVPFPGML